MKQLFLLLLLLFKPIIADAVEVEIDGIRYDLLKKTNTATVLDNPSSMYSGDIVIPSTITYEETSYNVITIGDNAFASCGMLTSIIIPNSVTSIGNGAFSGCSSMTSITIPNSVTTIGERIFQDCRDLNSVTIPNSVTAIGDHFFQNCVSLSSVTLPNSITSIGYHAFSDCGLTSISIPNNVTTVDAYAFSGCSGLTAASIGEGVTSIGEHAFSDCGLTSISIPNNVTTVGAYAFSGCSGLTAASIGDGVTSIGELAFYGCVNLNTISIPNGVSVISKALFSGCSGLTSIQIPNSVTTIGECAFAHCVNLNTIIIPASITNIGSSAFLGCSGLTSVHISDLDSWCKISFDEGSDGTANPLTKAHHLYINGEEIKDLVIPNSVTAIKNDAFKGCSGLTTVTMSNSVTSIGKRAFSDCSGLTSVLISNNMIDIEEYAFYLCSNLTTVSLPNNVKTIGKYAFEGCNSLTSASIGNGVTTIGEYAFHSCYKLKYISIGESVETIGSSAFANCEELTEVTCLAQSPPSSHSDVFTKSYVEYATLRVPASSIEKYKTTEPWSKFKEIIAYEEKSFEDADNVEVDGIYYNLNSDGTACVISHPDKYKGDIVIPEDVIYKEKTYIVTTIKGGENEGAFYNCKDMTTISIPKSIKTIGLGAFEHCSGLNAVYITDLISWLDIDFEVRLSTGSENFLSNPLCNAKYLYLNGERIQDLVIPESVTYVKRGAFCGGSFKTITFHKNVVGIGAFGFYYCKDLEDVYSYSPKIALEGNRLALHPQDVQNATLHIRERFLENYYTLTSSWKYFKNIVYVSGYDYKLLYIVDDVVYKEYIKEVGEEIIPEAEPTKNGYTFSGWQNLPETMPDHDVTVMGTFIPNSYKLTYIVDGEEYKVCELKCDSIITPEPDPTRKGMTFSGWSGIPEKMPAKNVTVTGTFSWTRLTKDKVIYEVSDTLANYCKVVGNDNAGGEIKIDSVEVDGCYYQPTEVADKAFYGCEDITKIEIPKTVGTIGERAFANIDKLTDVTIWAEELPTIDRTAFENSYIEDYVTLHVPYGAIGKYKETAPWKNFKEIVAIEGTQRTFTLTYMVDGEIYKTYEIKEGEPISPEIEPTKEGWTFSGWSEIPETMPAEDVTITGSFTQDIYEIEGASYVINDDGATIVKGDDKDGEVVIEATVTIHGKTYKVTVIGENAFKGGTKMSAVVIPDVIKIIGASAFEGCSRLRSINIGKGVLAIDHKAFANIGSGVGAAGTRGSEVGLKVSCSAEVVPATDDDVFENTDIENATLLVNDNLVEDYKSAIPWNGFGTIMGFEEASGIGVLTSEPEGTEIYSIDGRRLSKVQKGLNVVRTKDGVKKVVGR